MYRTLYQHRGRTGSLMAQHLRCPSISIRTAKTQKQQHSEAERPELTYIVVVLLSTCTYVHCTHIHTSEVHTCVGKVTASRRRCSRCLPQIPLALTVLIHVSQFSSVQSLSHVWLFATPWIAARQASLSITNSWSSLKLTSISSVMPSSQLTLCHPLFLLLPIPPSIRVFSNESTLHMRWPKYWSFSFSISPSKEIPGLISFRMDWLDLLAVQGTLKSLL